MRVSRPATLTRLTLALIFLASPLLLPGAAGAGPATLRVLQSTPDAGAIDVPASGFISITFDRPVVTLGDVGVAGAHPAAAITPAVAGQGRWINTSVWAYQIAGGLATATRYQVTTRPDLAAQDGSRMAGSYSFTFSTLRPAVASVTPTDHTQFALPGDLVQVVFNQPVRHASAQAAFSLRVNDTPVRGTFSWTDRLIATQPNGSGAVVPSRSGGGSGNATPPPAKDTVMTFHPAAPLPLGGAVQVTVGAGVLALGGPLPMPSPYSWSYAVAGRLSIADVQTSNGTSISDGASGVSLNGGLKVIFTVPVSQAALVRAVHITPRLSYQDIYVSDTGTAASIYGDFQPSTGYTLSIDARAIGTARQALAQPFTFRLSTTLADISVSLMRQGPVAVYNAYLGANVYIREVNIFGNLDLSLYRLGPDEFLRYLTNAPQNWSGTPPPDAAQVARWSIPTHTTPNRSLLIRQRLQVNGQDVPPGYYLVNASGAAGGGGSGLDYMFVLITHTSVTLKVGQHQVFVWATDLSTARPAAGESVSVLDSSGRVWAQGTTAADGVFQATVGGLRPDDSLLQHTLQAQLSRGSDVGACGLDWNNGVGPWDFNLPFTSYLQPVRLYLTTDRPIYRPGQPIYFKGIARRDNDGRYSLLPPGSPVQIQVQDARQNTIYNQRLKADAYGAFSGKLSLSPAAATGYYNINAGAGVSSASLSFQVAEYKKPDYAVTVISDRGANANYTQGERIGVQVRARYYFGAALGHAPVKWDLTQNNFFFSSPLFPDYDFTDTDYAATQQQTFFGQQVTEGTGATDAAGDFHFSVPADLGKNPQSQQFTLEAIVTGPDTAQVSERTQVVVHKAALYVGLRTVDYVGVAGKPSTIQVVTVSDDGSRTVGGVAVTASVYRRIWLSSYVRDANGFYYWQDKHQDKLVATVPVRTDGRGRASFPFTPKDGGEYRIVVTAADGAGRTATAATPLWVVAAGEQYVPWQTQNNDRIRLVADRKSYVPGETAHILVTAPLAGMTALLTVERGSILSHRVLTLPTNSARVDVPIQGDYAPDVYVSLTLVKGPGTDTSIPVWKLGYVALPVDTSARSLHVTLSSSIPRAQPGQQVSFTIHATDASGHGVQAQLAVALVDKAVLALAASGAASLMDTYYQSRDLGVESAGSLTYYIDRLNLNQKVGSKGGSGGGGGGQGPTRQKFPDTAYWNPAVVTDASGNATVTVTLPDNLTTWTLSAIGGTAGTLVGQNTLDLISSKDLLLEPAVPRFLTIGDTAAAGAVVNNLTGKTQRVQVSMQSRSGNAESAFATTVSVPAGGSQLVQWPVKAAALGDQTFLFTAQAAGDASLGDRLQVSLPVQPSSIAQVGATSGLFRGSVTETVQVPADAVPGEGDLTVTLAPSLVSGLGDAAKFLVTYPYDCAEQTTSRYYGLVQAARLPPGISGLSAALTSGIPATVQMALQRLYSAQNSDGGWSWWPSNPSIPYISAYVLEGLTVLSAQGYAVDPHVLKQATGYVHTWALNPPADTYLPEATYTLDLQAYSAYVLGEAGTPDAGLVSTLYTSRQNMLPFARAYLALAVARVASSHDPRVHALLTEVEAAAQQFDNQAHWSDASPDWLMMEDSTAATAIALDALVRLDPSNPLVLGAVRWLMTRRVDGAWDSTQSTALALRGLVDFAVRAQPLSGTSTFSITVNGSSLGAGTISAADRGAARTFTLPLAGLGSGPAKVTLQQHGGSGQMAYTLTLHTYQPAAAAPALEHGIVVARQYQTVDGSHGQAGSSINVVLTLTTPEDLYYLVVEDPLPAGAEPVDPSLRTTSVLSSITSRTTIPRGTTDLGWYVTHVELRDDRAAIFADYLPAGTYQYSYQIHLTSAGSYSALPTQAHLFYFPDVYGHGRGTLFTIKPQ